MLERCHFLLTIWNSSLCAEVAGPDKKPGSTLFGPDFLDGRKPYI